MGLPDAAAVPDHGVFAKGFAAALRNSNGYRYLLTCNLSPALHSYKRAELL
jgi:hypothetical protein